MKKQSLILLIFLLSIYGFFIEPNRLVVTNYKIQDRDLNGIKVVFAGDFHIKPNQQKRLDRIIEIINKQSPDIVLSTGDYVSGHTEESTMSPDKIAKCLGRVNSNYGFYTTLGNHDGWYGAEAIETFLENNGIKVLNNENVKLNINGKEFYIIGVEDLSTGDANLYKAIGVVDKPSILLTHSPDIFPKVPKSINLTLAGHTHGGQIRIPFYGAIFTASEFQDRYVQGLIIENDKKLITTRGIGVSILPIRFNCVPEIVVIEFIE